MLIPEARPTTLEQERGEAFEAVLEAMEAHSPDPDRAAACLTLLQHLTPCLPRGCRCGSATQVVQSGELSNHRVGGPFVSEASGDGPAFW
jgi:hypothetical protein